jgi:hypothetical protein
MRRRGWVKVREGNVYVVLTRQLRRGAQNRRSGENNEHREYPNTSIKADGRLLQAV